MTKQFKRKRIIVKVKYLGHLYEKAAWQITPNFAAVKCQGGYLVHLIETGDKVSYVLDGDTLKEVTARCQVMEELVPCDEAAAIVPELKAKGLFSSCNLAEFIDRTLSDTYSN